MPLMDHETYENLLSELLNPELETSRRTEILQSLRTDYSTVRGEYDQLTESQKKLQSEKDDLIVSNSKLFRQLGVVGGDDEHRKKEEQKSLSETIKLEDIEKEA